MCGPQGEAVLQILSHFITMKFSAMHLEPQRDGGTEKSEVRGSRSGLVTSLFKSRHLRFQVFSGFPGYSGINVFL